MFNTNNKSTHIQNYKTTDLNTLFIYNENVTHFKNTSFKSEGGGNGYLRAFRMDDPPQHMKLDIGHYALGIPTMEQDVDNTVFDKLETEITKAFASMQAAINQNTNITTMLWCVDATHKIGLMTAIRLSADKLRTTPILKQIQTHITTAFNTFADKNGFTRVYYDGTAVKDENGIVPRNFNINTYLKPRTNWVTAP